MNDTQWVFIIFLAFGAYAIRFMGLIGGQLVSENAGLNKLLSNLPGCLIVALIAASLAEADLLIWAAAAIAFVVALISNNVVATMGLGFVSILSLKLLFA